MESTLARIRLLSLVLLAGGVCTAHAAFFSTHVDEDGYFEKQYHQFDTVALFAQNDNLSFFGITSPSYPKWSAGAAGPVANGFSTVWVHGATPLYKPEWIAFTLNGWCASDVGLFNADYMVYNGSKTVGSGVMTFYGAGGGFYFTEGGAGDHANPVPEPFTMLLAVGALGSAVAARRRVTAAR